MTDPAYTHEEHVIARLDAIGTHVAAIRSSVWIVAFVATVQLVILGLWIFGAITVAFETDF